MTQMCIITGKYSPSYVKLKRPRSVREAANFEWSRQGKRGLVVATPWDANMDAEQKTERESQRGSVDDGNNCTAWAMRPGWWF